MNKLWTIHLMEHCTAIKNMGYIYEYIELYGVQDFQVKKQEICTVDP